MGHPQVAPPRAPGSSVSAQTKTGGTGMDWEATPRGEGAGMCWGTLGRLEGTLKGH